MPSLYIYDKSSFSSGFDNLFDNGGNYETGVGAVGDTITTSGDFSGVMVSITDNNFSLDDSASGQTLTDPVTINGVTYPAGSSIELGFVADMNSTDGVSRFYNIRIDGTVVGVSVLDPTSIAAPQYNPEVTGGISPNTTYTVFDVDNLQGGGTTTGYENFITCFTTGTMILTDRGEVAVEDLQAGDMVETKDEGLQEIRWIGSTRLSADTLAAAPELRPIRIKAGALGSGTPVADLVVSPQHRVLVRSAIAQRLFGAEEVLVAAKQLLLVEGIDVVEDLAEVEYFHFLFDDHQVVISNGAETESLYTGPQALKSVGPAALEEIFTIFPELRDREEGFRPEGARTLLSGRQGRKLAQRHAQKGRALVS